MGAEFRRLNSVKQSRCARVFTNLQKIFNGVGVEMIAEIIEVLEVGIIGESGVDVTAADFVAADVVQRLLLRSVLVDLPRKKLVERMARQPGAREQIITPPARL